MEEIELKMEGLEEESLRRQVLEAARKFKGNWTDLGRCLNLVREEQSFKEWGYPTLESYCTRELKLRKLTVSKLLKSFYFLNKEEPGFTSGPRTGYGAMPDYESVDILRKARAQKRISEDDYQKMRSSVFQKGIQPRELGKQYRSMLQAAREAESSPEEAWEKRRRETVKKALSSLRSVKDTLDRSSFLSHRIVQNLKKLIKQIEEELM